MAETVPDPYDSEAAEEATTPAVVIDGPRFAMVPEALLFDPAVSDKAARIYGVLARHGSTPDNCYPSHAVIAARIGCEKRSVQRPLRELERLGWIARRARYTERGDRTSDGYLLRLSAAQESAPPTQESADPPRDDARTPRAPGSTEREPGEREPSERENPSGALFGAAPADEEPPAPTGPTEEESFQAFWTAYPRSKGSKAAARKVWARALKKVGGDHGRLVAAALAFAGARAKEDWQFTPHPATWLNQERWNDDLPAPPRDEGPRATTFDHDEAPRVWGPEDLFDAP